MRLPLDASRTSVLPSAAYWKPSSGAAPTAPAPVTHERSPSSGSRHLETHPDPPFVDVVRLKAPAVPAHHRLVLLVERVPARFEKLHEAGDTSHVFGRTPPLASDTYRVVDVALPVPHLLDEEVVAPVVAEVVDVEKLHDVAVDDRLQPDARRLVEPFIRIPVVLGLAIAPVPDLELEQVRVRPEEREPDEIVEGEQGRRERHVDPAPDRGLDLLKFDSDPGDWLDHGGLRRRDDGDSALGGEVPSDRIFSMTSGRDLGGIVRLVGPRRRVPLHDLEPFLFGHDSDEGMRAPEPLSLVRILKQDLADLAPRALQDLLPLFACPAEGAVESAPSLEVLMGDVELARVRVDPFDDDSRHVE